MLCGPNKFGAIKTVQSVGIDIRAIAIHVEEPIPDSEQAWIDAADHYLGAGFERKGDTEALSVLAYQVAETYLRVNRLDDARERFKKVIACHPKSEVAAYSIATIINSYRAQNDFPNLEKWADLAEQLELGDPELQAAIRKEIKVFKESFGKVRRARAQD